MENKVKIFENPQFGEIRTSGSSEEPMFCLADICKVLELQPSSTKNRLKKDGVSSIKVIDNLGREQNAIFINEQNLYKVIMRSDKPQAEAFQDWVCGEVLPSIRKSGGYIATNEDEGDDVIMARALKLADAAIKRKDQQLQMAQSTIQEQEREIKEIAPMANYTKEVLQSNSTYTLTQVSKDLNFRSIYTFLDWAQKHELLYKQSGQWMPTAKVSGEGYFTTRTAKFVKSDNTVGTSISTVVTEKGRAFLHELLAKKGGEI